MRPARLRTTERKAAARPRTGDDDVGQERIGRCEGQRQEHPGDEEERDGDSRGRVLANAGSRSAVATSDENTTT